jgi:predicted tellurium resistance membrane protein TerC
MRPPAFSLHESLPLILKIVYTYKYLIPLCFALLFFVAYKHLRRDVTPFFVSSTVIALNVLGVLLFVSFPNLGDKEQLQYA